MSQIKFDCPLELGQEEIKDIYGVRYFLVATDDNYSIFDGSDDSCIQVEIGDSYGFECSLDREFQDNTGQIWIVCHNGNTTDCYLWKEKTE